jgi:hypothetical protein
MPQMGETRLFIVFKCASKNLGMLPNISQRIYVKVLINSFYCIYRFPGQQYLFDDP